MRLIFGVFFEKNEKKSVILATISGFMKKKVLISRNSTFLQKITFFQKNIYKAKTGFWDTPKIQKWRFSLIFLNFFLTNFGPSGAMRIWWIWTWGDSKMGLFWGLSGLGGQKCSINRTFDQKWPIFIRLIWAWKSLKIGLFLAIQNSMSIRQNGF